MFSALPSVKSGSGSSATPMSKAPRQMSIQQGMDRSLAAAAEGKVAKWFYTNGVAFNTVEDPAFKEMCVAVAKAGEGFKPPSSFKLRNSLLAKAVAELKADLKVTYDVSIPVTGCSLISDGWSDTCNRPLINLIITTPKGPKFLDAVNSSSEYKNADYVAGVLSLGIELAGGADNVVQIVTDAAAVNSAAVKVLQTDDSRFG